VWTTEGGRRRRFVAGKGKGEALAAGRVFGKVYSGKRGAVGVVSLGGSKTPEARGEERWCGEKRRDGGGSKTAGRNVLNLGPE